MGGERYGKRVCTVDNQTNAQSQPHTLLQQQRHQHQHPANNQQTQKREIKKLNSQLVKLEGWKRAERRQIRSDLKQLYKEERSRQEKAVTEVVAAGRVVCCTLSGALHRHLQGERFDVCVIDEAAQALEAACWSALLKAGRAVLAGDHLQ